MIAISCGIKISYKCTACFCHKARVWQTDRQTDGQTDTELRQLMPRLHSGSCRKLVHFFSLLLETYWSRSGAGAERAKNLVSGSGCEKMAGAGAGGRGAGIGSHKTGLSGEQKFFRSRSAHMHWSVNAWMWPRVMYGDSIVSMSSSRIGYIPPVYAGNPTVCRRNMDFQ